MINVGSTWTETLGFRYLTDRRGDYSTTAGLLFIEHGIGIGTRDMDGLGIG